MKRQKTLITLMLLVGMILISSIALFSGQFSYLPFDLNRVSNYNEERVVYHRIEKQTALEKDPSYEALLIVKDRKQYLIMDGYDNYSDMVRRRNNLAIEFRTEDYDALWPTKINAKPDYIEIVNRRVLMMRNNNEEFVSTNFGSFYKSIRDKFIREHVTRFRQLMNMRAEADLYVERKALKRSIYADAIKEPQKFSTLIKARASDETIYLCEDADGDGVTETLSVTRGDGFNWGYKSGPNLIFIYGNTDKDIETLIGKLANEAANGTVEEEKEIIQTFPKEKDIADLIKFITPMEPKN